ncbi:PH domain-containing protein [Asanoa sp. WMMD1127]|uniref:PH domain-containing protein n=1 Tax=Asanoa sp. WMMD1127 TaxID=3016107 RepID=UPI002416367C|nr:PH domain-containing protein [Asanoa sp. WMMD1127]MDG4820693.1 PH domain-containing protein [Asanoa sp. WMMD1127]
MGELGLHPPRHRVAPRAVAWWTLRGVIGGAAPIAAGLIVFTFVESWRAWLGPLLVALAVIIVAHAAVVPTWRYRVHRWEATDDAVYALSGWFVREWRVAPLSRVQTVDATRGPLQRLLGLATVTVTTASASGPVQLVALPDAEATEVAAALTATVNRTAGDAT